MMAKREWVPFPTEINTRAEEMNEVTDFQNLSTDHSAGSMQQKYKVMRVSRNPDSKAQTGAFETSLSA